MKTLVIYSSATGFTEKYARRLAERVHADLLTLEEASKRHEDCFNAYDALVYGGWAIGGKIHKSKWFLEHLEQCAHCVFVS